MTPIRVLMSARDPGGAAQVREVAPVLRADARLRVAVAASGPAFETLAAGADAPHRFALPDGATHVGPGSDPRALLDAARRLVDEVDPDVVVTGISSLGVGLDEALLAVAGGRPTFALQDYPGGANAIDGALAGTYFVRDEGAAALMRARFGVSAIPIGSVRHVSYARLDVARLRAEARARAGATPDRPVIGFFGQPAEIPGHEAAFTHLVEALAGLEPPPLVILREHPKSHALRGLRADALARAGATVHDASDAPAVEPWLAACDLVTTCFSHCTMDYAFLSAWSEAPLGSVLFLMTTPDARRFIREYGGLEVPDGVEVGLGRVAETAEEVRPLLAALLTGEGRHAYHAASRRLPRRVAFERVVEAVVEAGRARAAAAG